MEQLASLRREAYGALRIGSVEKFGVKLNSTFRDFGEKYRARQ